MARWKVVATGPWADEGWQRPLEEGGCEVVLGPPIDLNPNHRYSEQELVNLLSDADAVLYSTREKLPRSVLEKLPNLKVVAKATIGVEGCDLDAATDCGILVFNSPAPENYLGVAEATIGFMMDLTKRVMYKRRHLAEGNWRDQTTVGTLLAGTTVGIVGLGRIGTNVARRLSGWDVRLLAHDPYVDPGVAYAVGVELVSFEQLIRESDVVSVHVVLTDETRNMIDAEALRSMKETAVVINTSRGEAVDEAALAQAISDGWIAGCALDVYAQEPLPMDSPLRALDPDRVILTPHSIGNNPAVQTTGTRMAMENLLKALSGQVPHFVKNPEVIDRWKARL